MQQSQAELAALKAQLNPHFFFNTLNSLYGTALLEQATNTAQSIEQLANIMRYTLGEAQRDFTPVASELGFLQDYIQLQGLRLAQTDANRLQTHLVYDELPAQIAPLLLITFVENAFLYGVSTDLDYFIAIQLTIEKGQLDLVVENRLFPQRTAYGLGTGIQNARKRLDLLYAGKYSLTAGPQADRFRVHLQMNLH
ncbi:sensor histidine kinase [Spirosoma pollinicola]|uniref:sensor histidine kinase n=1 Tax=Spirosoma pollinicola TaxID=2057025 RepID=UPI0012FD4F87|nr:histidine kinase [Spirosoma pollinicola]